MLILAELPDVRTGTGIASVIPAGTGQHQVKVTTEAGDMDYYDAVVLATHTDTSLHMLGDSAPKVHCSVFASDFMDMHIHSIDCLCCVSHTQNQP